MTLNLIQDPKKVLSTLFQFLEFKFAKIFLLKAYIAIHRVDIICISETYLDSSNSPDVTIWKYPVIIWYCLIILQTINEDVFVYVINIFYLLWEFIVQYLQECIKFEVKIGDKVCNFISRYRSPSQTLQDLKLGLKTLN